MTTIESSLDVDAWVIGGRHRHHRQRDHFGADSDLYVALEEPLGPWQAGTPIHYVLQDLFARINVLTSSNHNIRVATLDALVLTPSTDSILVVVPGTGRGVKTLDALVFKKPTSTFTLNARVTRGGSVTLNAFVPYGSVFYVNAFVV
jgi:hypothetical protein